MPITMANRRVQFPDFFKGKIKEDFWSGSAKMVFPALPITFHTIEDDDLRWYPKKHKPIIVDAWAWVMRLRNQKWALHVQNALYTNINMPHCYESNSCLRPAELAGDYSRGVWPMNVPEDYDKARERIIHLLGGINLDSLLTGLNWGFDPSLVLPKKLFTPENTLDVHGTCDYYAHEWNVSLNDEEEEGEDDDE